MMVLTNTDYELRLLVDPDRTLGDRFEPVDGVRDAFDIDERQRIVMQFVDGLGLPLNEAGWNVRLRAFEGENKLQLTYKKRYPIDDDADADDAIDSAKAQAKADGFGDDPDEYESQVEWGRRHKTLSISKKVDLAPEGPDPLDLPGEQRSREIAVESIPARLEEQVSPVSAGNVLAEAHLFGPVRGERWKGKWRGKKVSFEVWHIKPRQGEEEKPVVEVSLKEDDRDEAKKLRKKLRKLLEKQGWLIDGDSLKTQMILERYRGR
jgi:hypothetical protein